MAERVVLHVGTMKSGTTTLQGLLFGNRDVLRERGVLVPGVDWGEQVRGARDVIAGGGPTWSSLVAEIGAWPGTAVLSMEYFGTMRPHEVALVAQSLPRLSVVVTTRDLNRQLASMWQETVQNGRSWGRSDYLAGARASRPPSTPDGEAGRTFWRQQDLVRIVRRWGEVAPVTVVTLPPPGGSRSALVERFATAAEVDLSGLSAAPANESVGAISAVLLRRVNAALASRGIGHDVGREVRKDVLAKEVLAARAAGEPRLGLELARWVRSHARTMVKALRDVPVVGDWRDLRPVAVPGIVPASVSDADLVDAARAGFEGLRERFGGVPWQDPTSAGDAVELLARQVAAILR